MENSPVPPVAFVLILRADRLYADVLRQMVLRVFPRVQVTIAATVEAAALIIARDRVDLFITGLGTAHEGDVLDLLVRAARQSSRVDRVLVATAGCEYRLLAALRTLEIKGVFDAANELPEAFMVALRAVGAGSRYWSQSFVDLLQQIGSTSTGLFRLLTAFEQVVLSIIGDGCDDNVAAQKLGISPSTVSTVRRELHRKLGVQHRGELVRAAAQHGFVRFTPAGVVRPGFALLCAGYHARKPRRPELGAEAAAIEFVAH